MVDYPTTILDDFDTRRRAQEDEAVLAPLRALVQPVQQQLGQLQSAVQNGFQGFQAPSHDDLLSHIGLGSQTSSQAVSPQTPSVPAGTATPVPGQTTPSPQGFQVPSLDDLLGHIGLKPPEPPPTQTTSSPDQTSRTSQTAPATGVAPTQPVAASGQPQAMPSGGAPAQAPGDLESWARSEAARLHIDPDTAVRVAGTEGGFSDPTRQNMQGAPAYGPYQAYIGGTQNPGLGDEMLQHGIDPRNPAHARAAITYSLEHAAQNGWGAFQGAAANGIGQWEGIGPARGTGSGPSGVPSPGMVTVQMPNSTQTMQVPSDMVGEGPGQYGASKGWKVVSGPTAPSGQPTAMPQASATSSSYTQQGLADAGDPDAWAKCGPVAALQFAQATGRNPTPTEVEQLARNAGWTPQRGMAGLASEAQVLQGMGIAARPEPGVNWGKVVADVSRGNPVILQLPGHEGHYITAQSYDPQTGKIDFGSTVGDLAAAGHRTQFTPSELEGLGWGTPNASLYLDNPATPAPSVAAGSSAPNAASPPSEAASPAAPAGAAPSAPAGAPDPLRDQLGNGSGVVNYRAPLLPTGGPDTTPEAPYDPRAADQGAHEAPQQPDLSQTAPTTYGASGDSPQTPAYTPPAPSEPAQSPLKPLYDLAGRVIGYVHAGADAVGQAASGAVDQIGQNMASNQQAVREANAATGYGQVTSTPGEPDYANTSASPWDINRPIPITPQQPRPPYSPEQTTDEEAANRASVAGLQPGQHLITPIQPQGAAPPAVDTTAGIDFQQIPSVAAETARQTIQASLEDFAASGRSAQQGQTLNAIWNAALGALNAAGVPYVVGQQVLNEMLPVANTPAGTIGAGDVIMTAQIAHDVAALVKAGVPITRNIYQSLRNGIPVETIIGTVSRGLNAAAGGIDAGIAAARGVGTRVSEGLGANAPRIATSADGLPALPDGYVRVIHTTPPAHADAIVQSGLNYSGLNDITNTAIRFDRPQDVSSRIPYGNDPNKVSVVMDMPRSEYERHLPNNPPEQGGERRASYEMPGVVDPKYVVGVLPTSELDRAGELARAPRAAVPASETTLPREVSPTAPQAPSVAAGVAPGAVATGTRPVLATEAQAIVNHLAGQYPNIDNPDIVNAIAGQPVDTARRLLRGSWAGSGNSSGSVQDFWNAVDEAMTVGEREARGRVFDPRMEAAGYGQRQTGGHADLSPLAESGDQRYNVDPTRETRQPIPRTVDDTPRGGTISLNATPGVSRSAGLLGDVANSLGGGVGGAAVGGGLPADTPEERRRNALIGAGVGMVAGPAVGRLMPREGGALATFGASPNYRPPTPAQLKVAEIQGARRGEMLNREVVPPGSAVPRMVQAATKATDDRAAMRWAEDQLTDLAGQPRLAENDPARPSTMSRINAGSVANERIANDLEQPLIDAAQAGLQRDLPRYLEDQHHLDILNDFYTRGSQAVMDARQPVIDAARARGVAPAVIARMEAKAAADADTAGTLAMRRRQGSNPEHTFEATDARLQEQQQRLQADGRWGQLQSTAQAVWDHNAQTLQRLADSGNVDPAKAAELQQRYPHYVPTVPLSHLEAAGGGAASATTTVSRGKTPSISALEDIGTSGERLNPIVATRNQTIRAEKQIQRNGVAQAFARMMDDATAADPQALAVNQATHRTLLGGGVNVSYFQDGTPVTLSVPKPVADGIEAAANMGVSGAGVAKWIKRLNSVVTSTLTAARPAFIPVNVMRDLSDYATRTMVREGNNPLKLPAILSTWADEAGKAALDIMAAQRTGRSAMGAAAGFAAGALPGDENTPLSTRLIHGAEGAAAGAFLGGANKVGATGKAAEFLARGGGEGAAQGSLKAGQRWYRDVMREGGVPLTSTADALRYLGDWAHDVVSLQGIKGISERTELISRTAAMRRADAQGADPIMAMIAGRDASVDFDRAGTVIRAWNGVIPFLNATVQGGAQFGRMMRQNPVATTAAITSTLGPVMLATEYYNRSDPARAQAYDDVPQYLKDSGIVLMMPGAGGSDIRGTKPNYLWLPTEALSPFVVAMRAAMQHADAVVPGMAPSAGRSDAAASMPVLPDAARQPLGALNEALSVFYPVKGDTATSIASTAVPPPFRQMIELGQNKDMFRGNPIQSASQDERASGFGHAVANAANRFGQTLGNQTLQDVHPSQVDYLARQMPAYGDLLTGASDMVKPSPYKQAETGRVANLPFFGGLAARFVRDAGGATNERLVGSASSPNIQAVFRAANVRPSEIDLAVPADYRNAPLTRAEQNRWQKSFNAELNYSIRDAQSDRQWDDPMTRKSAVQATVTQAQERAAHDALGLSESDIRDRIDRASVLKRKAIQGR